MHFLNIEHAAVFGGLTHAVNAEERGYIQKGVTFGRQFLPDVAVLFLPEVIAGLLDKIKGWDGLQDDLFAAVFQRADDGVEILMQLRSVALNDVIDAEADHHAIVLQRFVQPHAAACRVGGPAAADA